MKKGKGDRREHIDKKTMTKDGAEKEKEQNQKRRKG